MSGISFRPHPAITWEKISEIVVTVDHDSGLVQHLSRAHSRAFLDAIHGGQSPAHSRETHDLEAAGLIVGHNRAPAPARRAVVSGMASGVVMAALWLPTPALASSTPEPTLIEDDLSSANWKWASISGGFSVTSFADLKTFDDGTLFVAGETWVISIVSFGDGLTAAAQVIDGTRRLLGFNITSDSLPTGDIQARLSQTGRNLVSSPFTVTEAFP